MYRYTFSFTLKLTATLLQKFATFHMWNVKQKDNGMDQNTLQWRSSGVFIVNFGHISHLVLVFLLLTLTCNRRLGSNMILPFLLAAMRLLSNQNVTLMANHDDLNWLMIPRGAKML